MILLQLKDYKLWGMVKMKPKEYINYNLSESLDFFQSLKEIRDEIKDTWIEDNLTIFGIECMLDGSFLIGVNIGSANLILDALETFLHLIAGRIYEMSRIEIRLFHRGSHSWLDQSLPRKIQ